MQTDRRTFLAGLLAGAVAVSTRSAFAADKEKDSKEKGEWEKLGELKVGKKEERDVIEVKSPHGYTALSFRVADGDVEIEDVKVTFDDDKTFSPESKLRFREGERSGKIDLPGNTRAIKRIRFLYRTLGRGEAVVAVYGKIGDAVKEKR
jgi:hypothetical protein